LATGDQLEQTIVASGTGGAIVAWQDPRSEDPGDVYAQYVQPNGQLGGDVLSVPGGSATTVALDPVRPNPSRGGGLAVRFTLGSAATGALELFDAAGRCLAARDLGSLGAGQHSLELGGRQPLSPGVYLVRVRQGGQSATRRVCIVY
jgi:hypothetical protein